MPPKSSLPPYLFLFVILACSLAVFAQDAPPPQFPFPHPQIPQNDPTDEARKQIEKDMAKKATKERQQQLVRDTDKLLQLATELKNYVDKTNENILSLDVIKKAEQIEKLAHSVREKMKGE